MDIVSFLREKDEVSYIDIIEPIREGVAQVLYAEPEGIVIQIDNNTLNAVVFDEQALGKVADILLSYDVPIAVHDEILFKFMKTSSVPYHLSAVQPVYMRKDPIVFTPTVRIEPMVMDDFPVLVENYHHADKAYLRGRIECGSMLKAVVDGKVAAFIGRHSEGTIGLLEVLPEYRRRHIGEQLEMTYINLLLESGRVPYCHVAVDNEASLALQRKLGFVTGSSLVHWFH